MGGIFGWFKGLFFGTERDELSLSGSYKAMCGDLLKVNKALMDENMRMREGVKTSPWDVAIQFLALPPDTQGKIIGQLPAIAGALIKGPKKPKDLYTE